MNIVSIFVSSTVTLRCMDYKVGRLTTRYVKLSVSPSLITSNYSYVLSPYIVEQQTNTIKPKVKRSAWDSIRLVIIIYCSGSLVRAFFYELIS